jgi:hypothetical protein
MDNVFLRPEVMSGAVYVLISKNSSAERVELFHQIDDLAVRAYKLSRGGAWLLSARLGSGALSMAALAKRGRLAMEQRAGGFAYHGRWFMGPYASYERRAGPVEHTACRPGGKGCHKRFAHIGAKKLAQYFLSEGERAPRGKQSVSSLPNPWDDHMLAYERGWKARGKLGKAWAKLGARAPKSDRIAMAAWLVGLARVDDEGPEDDVD